MRLLKLILLTALAGICPAELAAADPPGLRSIFPPGLQRGVETKAYFLGRGFTPAMELVLPFPAEVRHEPAGAEQSHFIIKPRKDSPGGVFPVRVRSAHGVSNMLLLAVDDLPRVREVEPNGQLREAQRIDWPVVVAGTVGGRGAPHPSKDVDVYKFSVKAGQRLTFVSETRRLGLTPDLALRLRDPKGRELAFHDDVPGLGVDPRLDYTFKETGEYTVELHLTDFNYTGRNFGYQLKVGALDYARSVFPLGGKRGDKISVTVVGRGGETTTVEAAVPADPRAEEWWLLLEKFPGSLPWRMAIGDWREVREDSMSKTAQTVPWPATVNGRIAGADEVDRYRLAVKPGQKVRVRVEAFYHGSALSGRVRVLDRSGKLVVEDYAKLRSNMDPRADFTVPDGMDEAIVTIEDCFGRGGIDYPYRLTIEPGGPDFDLLMGKEFPPSGWPENDALNLPVNQPVKLSVRVQRRGYLGPIQLKAVDLPNGVAAPSVTIPEAKTVGDLVLTASARAPAALFEIGLVGEAQIDGRMVRRKVVRPVHIAEPYFTNLPWNWRLDRLTASKVEGVR